MSHFLVKFSTKLTFSFIGLFFFFQLLWAQSPIQLPEKFYDQKIAGNWQRPVGVTFDDQGRGFVWEKRGQVHIIDELGNKLPNPLIDISDEVGNWGDHGLLGFALDPSFDRNGYFYLLYVVDRHHVEAAGTPDYDPSKNEYDQATIGRITRYTADILTNYTSVLDDSRTILLGHDFTDGFPILLPSHGIGSLAFGSDGTLLASCGDGGSYESIDSGNAEETYYQQALLDGTIRAEENVGAFKAQMVNSLNGKIIRIDPQTGLGLPSNPYFDPEAPDSPQSKTWVLGFRNPFRFLVVPNTGEHLPEKGKPGTLLIGDVGSSSWEELNIAPEGALNFGWPVFEGPEYHWGYLPAYTPNLDAPNPLATPGVCGSFFNFQDLVIPSTRIRNTVPNSCDRSIVIPETTPSFIHERPTLTWSGKLWNPPPRAKVTGFNGSGEAIDYQLDDAQSPITAANFAGFTSVPGFFYEGDNFPESYQGKFFQADLSGWIRTFTFNDNLEIVGIDTFALWDDKGVVHIEQNPHNGCIYWTHIYSSEVHKICFGGNPSPVAVASLDQSYGPSPLNVNFFGEASFDPDGSAISYFWDFGDGQTSTEINPSHEFTAAGNSPTTFEVSLTVTDSAGLTNQQALLVSLNNTPPDVSINGLPDTSYYPISGTDYLEVSATVNDAEHPVEALDYTWEVFFHHNDHYHPEAPTHNLTTNMVVDPVGCEEEVYWYRVKLTVTDANGLSSSDEKELFPNCAPPFLAFGPIVGEVTERQIQLDWSIVELGNTSTLIVERSLDLKYEPLGEVALNTLNEYQFLDNNPLNGINKYRIKALNPNGAYEYSKVVEIEYPPKLAYSIAPNPARDLLNVSILEPQSDRIELGLYNGLGQLIQSFKWAGEIGQAFSQTIFVDNLQGGVYIYRLTDGEQEIMGELIVVR